MRSTSSKIKNTQNPTMPPRLNFAGFSRSIAIRTRPQMTSHQSKVIHMASRRCFADDKTPSPRSNPNPTGSGIGHVSEEAAEVSDITGETGPDLGQGTPVQEVGSIVDFWLSNAWHHELNIDIFRSLNVMEIWTRRQKLSRKNLLTRVPLKMKIQHLQTYWHWAKWKISPVVGMERTLLSLRIIYMISPTYLYHQSSIWNIDTILWLSRLQTW